MKLKYRNSIFNMGDTSIRVKQVVDINKEILKQLNSFMKTVDHWEKNTVQEDFYRSFIQEIVRIEEEDGIELFRDFTREKKYREPNKKKIGFRGRTLTNALVKIGLIDSKRKISEVGIHYLNNELSPADRLEQVLGLYSDNLVYLRQCLKLRIYSNDSDDYFYNFRFALKFLSIYDNVPQNDFLRIVQSITPKLSEDEINGIIDTYGNVSSNNQTFEEYYRSTFCSTLRSQEELDEVRLLFINKSFSDENFIKYFPNGDSKKTPLLYKQFVLALIDLVDNHSVSAFEIVKKLSNDDKIKKAFSYNRLPFVLRTNDNLDQFLETNKENPLLHQDHYHIYLQFILSKHDDLVREYSDVCRRVFQITGLISFDNGLVNLNNKWIIQPLLALLGDSFKLNGSDSYQNYENDLDSNWFKDNTFMEILGISDRIADELFEKIGMQFNIIDITDIPRIIHEQREKEYRDFICTHFPKEKIIKILKNIYKRDDEEVFKLVTYNATIPTIYEYILTIAWYYICEKKGYLLHESFQVTLDGNKLPLTHRGGGAGDIEIITKDYALLIEATLMDMNTQKRGELEPVIRHSINFKIQNNKESKQIQSIFIANELDDNVLNIFRATQFIQLNGTTASGNVDGLNIFALTTNDIIRILEEDKKDVDILKIINNRLDTKPTHIENNWRTSILDLIFA